MRTNVGLAPGLYRNFVAAPCVSGYMREIDGAGRNNLPYPIHDCNTRFLGLSEWKTSDAVNAAARCAHPGH